MISTQTMQTTDIVKAISSSMTNKESTLENPQKNDTKTFPQLSFHINNISDPANPVPNTIYATKDAKLNHLQLTISTNTAGATFNAGSTGPVPPDQASTATGSLLYLDLSSLNLPSIDATAFSAPGWLFAMYDQTLCMYIDPKAGSVSIDSVTDQLIIDVKSMVVTQSPGGAGDNLIMTYYRVKNITKNDAIGTPINFKVMVQNPSNGESKLYKQIAFNVAQADIINSSPTASNPVTNSLTFNLSPTQEALTVLAGSSTFFTLSFVYGTDDNGYGALTTPDYAKDFLVSTIPSGWTKTSGTDKQNPSWVFKAPANKAIVGTGPGSVLEFTIDNIVTTFQAGPTLAYFSYTGIPGYEDGSYYVVLNKIPHVTITDFTIIPSPAELNNGQATITLNWETSYATELTLAGEPIGSIDVTDQLSYTTTIQEETLFTLIAKGTDSDKGNSAYSNKYAKVQPIINSFAATPSKVYYKDFPRNIDLSWNVDTNNSVQITSSIPGTTPILSGSIQNDFSYAIKYPQMLTLTPSDSSATPQSPLSSKSRNLTLSAFQIAAQEIPLQASPTFVAISPSYDFIAVTNTDQNSVSLLDTINYQPIQQSPISVGKNPMGLVFSPDGNFLFTANSGDGSVSIFQITKTGDSPFSFIPLSTLIVGGAPQQIVTSQDGKYLYVTVDNGPSKEGSLAVLQKTDPTTFTLSTQVKVGISPRGVAVLPSNGQVYVANSGDDTVSVITNIVGTFVLSNSVNFDHNSNPTGLAIASASGFDYPLLLVVCSASNKLCSINTNDSSGTILQSLAIGNQPAYISVMSGAKYAFINSIGDGSIALIGYDSTKAKWDILETSLDADASKQPKGIAVSDEGGTLVVANSGNGSLSLFTLMTYKPTASKENPLTVGRYPTDVMVTADSLKVLCWHNSFITISGQPSFDGIAVYDVASGIVESSVLLESQHVVGCATSPYLPTSVAFAITLKNPNVIVLNTSAPYSILTTLAIPPAATNQVQNPRSLALSMDGSILYVVTEYADDSHQVGLIAYSVDAVQGSYTLLFNKLLFKAQSNTSTLLCVNSDGSKAFITDSAGQQMWIVDYDASKKSMSIESPLPICTYPTSITIMPDGSQVFLLGRTSSNTAQSNIIWRLNVKDGAILSVILPESVGLTLLNEIRIAPDGSTLYASDGAIGGLRLLNPSSLRFIQSISWEAGAGIENPSGIAILPDASKIFTANIGSGNLGLIQQVQPQYDQSVLYSGTPYLGFFMRHDFGEVPSDPGEAFGRPITTMSLSPDIIITGLAPAPDPSIYCTQANYNTPVPEQYLYDSVTNYVYVRGLNSSATEITARVWLYLVDSNILLAPENWNSNVIKTANTQNYIELTVPAGALGITSNPFEIAPGAVAPNTHYCLCAISETLPLSDPPTDPRPGDFATWADLVAFVNGSINYAWANTVEAPTDSTWTKLAPLTNPTPSSGSGTIQLMIGIQCQGMPTDGAAFSYSVPGPAGCDGISISKTSITNPNQIYTVEVTWPVNFPSTYISITYWEGNTKAVNPSTISVYVAVDGVAVERALQQAGKSEEYIRECVKSLPNELSYDQKGSSAGYRKVSRIGAINYKFS